MRQVIVAVVLLSTLSGAAHSFNGRPTETRKGSDLTAAQIVLRDIYIGSAKDGLSRLEQQFEYQWRVRVGSFAICRHDGPGHTDCK